MKNKIKNIANNLFRESFEALRNLHESIEPSKRFVCMYVVYVVCHGVFYNVKHVDKYAHEYFEQSNSIELNEFFSFYSISYGSLCCFFILHHHQYDTLVVDNEHAQWPINSMILFGCMCCAATQTYKHAWGVQLMCVVCDDAYVRFGRMNTNNNIGTHYIRCNRHT